MDADACCQDGVDALEQRRALDRISDVHLRRAIALLEGARDQRSQLALAELRRGYAYDMAEERPTARANTAIVHTREHIGRRQPLLERLHRWLGQLMREAA